MQNIEIKVEGMKCTGCENRIKNALATLDGVEEVTANHETGIVTVKMNDEVSKTTVEEKIIDLGFDVVKES